MQSARFRRVGTGVALIALLAAPVPLLMRATRSTPAATASRTRGAGGTGTGGTGSRGSAGAGRGREQSEADLERNGGISRPDPDATGAEQPSGLSPAGRANAGEPGKALRRGITKKAPKVAGGGEREGEEGEAEAANERAPRTPIAPTAVSRRGRPRLPQSELAAAAKRDAGAAAPGDFQYFDSEQLATNANIIPEPSISSDGPGVLETWNTYAATSTDGGRNFSFINPATNFPSTFGGLCCDQLAYYEPTRGLFIWILQYFTDAANNNAIRIAVARNRDDMAAGAFYYWDLTPQQIGAPDGTNYDQPKIESDNANVFLTIAQYGARGGSAVLRLPITTLASAGTLGYDYYLPTLFSPVFADGSTSTMFFAAHVDTDTLRVYRWDDSSGSVASDDVNHTSYPVNLPYRCARTGGSATSDWCQRRSFGGGWAGDDRMKTGWLSNGVLGFAWTASQGSGGFGTFSYPYVHVVRVNATTRALIDQPIIWNTNHAWIWPYFSINARGDVGGSVMYGGGNTYQSCAAAIWDGYSGGSWQVFGATSNAVDPTDRLSGDYLGAQGTGNIWNATCTSLNDAGNGSRPIFMSFGRAGDNPLRTLSVGTSLGGRVDADRAGLACGFDCSEAWVVGTKVRLTATASAGSAFVAWSGACSGQQRTCDLTIGADTSVYATFAAIPANDSFASLSTLGFPSGTTTGTTTGASKEPGEPFVRPSNAHSVWYRYTPTLSGTLVLNTCGSSFDTTLGVYTGSAVSSLTAVASNDDSCGYQSQVTVPVTAGTTYRIMVDGYALNYGPFTLSWTFTAAPTLSGTPSNATYNVAYSFPFTVTGVPAPTVVKAAGSLPPGLTLSSAGVLSGKPTSPGTYSFTLTADNGIGSASAAVNLDVRAGPGFTIGDATVFETRSGSQNAVFTVRLDAPRGIATSVNYTVGTPTDTATAGSDYTPGTGTLNFPAGTITRRITVPVAGDLDAAEIAETFRIKLSTPVGAPIGDPLGLGRILNNPVAGQRVAIGDALTHEGDTGNLDLVFTVSLAEPAAAATTVGITTVNGTATAGSDFAAVGPLNVTFAPGEQFKLVVVPVIGDTVAESNETFKVKITPPAGLTVARANGIGTIRNND